MTGADEERTQIPHASNAGDLFMQHLGILLSTGTVFFVAIRVLGVSGYDVNTALAVVQNGGVATVAIASVVTIVPVVLGGTAIGLALIYAMAPGPGDPRILTSKHLLLGYVILASVSVAIVPWPHFALAAAIAAIGAIRHAFVAYRQRRTRIASMRPEFYQPGGLSRVGSL